MNRTFAVAVIVIIMISSFAGIGVLLNAQTTTLPQAYVGVTYCGNSIEQGKQLVDKVKDCTNLFVLQSGLLERDLKSVDELGDYAISKGMYFLPYFGAYVQSTFLPWVESAKQKWGSHLLGIYYSDEPAGKMLDGYVQFKDKETGDTITKTQYGDIIVEKSKGIVIQYLFSGDIKLYQPNSYSDINNEAIFYANGSINLIKAENGLNDFDFKSYQQLNSLRPFRDNNETAEKFVVRDRENIGPLKSNNTKIFTSDYALYWFDYLSGYDVVLGQIGWNMTFEQQIAFLRGAATTQNKDWGIFITWKYQQSPYLDNGEAIFNQMRSAYECGAKYLVLFNYYDTEQNQQGTLKEEHFQALKSFWTNVLNNPQETRSSIKANSVLILPVNYGWGARWNTDHIWGIFPADNNTLKIWNLMENIFQVNGLKTDIIYKSEQSQISSQYQNIYRYNK